MLSIVKSMALHGLDGYLVNVEVDVSAGLPSWDIVGLPDTSVREAKERVRTAIRNSNIDFQSKRIIVNLSPADTKKEGSSFDLPIAIGILTATDNIKNNNLDKVALIGELSLDGTINKVNGVLPMCIEAAKFGIKEMIVPKQNAIEAGIVKDIKIIPVERLEDVINYLNNIKEIEPIKVDTEELFKNSDRYLFDFSEVKGQESIKRALEVAAAGGHNCLLLGSPGSRKNNACKKNSINIARFEF